MVSPHHHWRTSTAHWSNHHQKWIIQKYAPTPQLSDVGEVHKWLISWKFCPSVIHKYSYLLLQECWGGPGEERDGGLLQARGVLPVQLPHSGGHSGHHHMSEARRCGKYRHHDIIILISMTLSQVCAPCQGDTCDQQVCERNTIVVCNTVHQVCPLHHHNTIQSLSLFSHKSETCMQRIISSLIATGARPPHFKLDIWAQSAVTFKQ